MASGNGSEWEYDPAPCPNCGSKNVVGAAACWNCMADLTGAPRPPGSSPGMSGLHERRQAKATSLARIRCGQCGAANVEGEAVCWVCGRPLSAVGAETRAMQSDRHELTRIESLATEHALSGGSHLPVDGTVTQEKPRSGDGMNVKSIGLAVATVIASGLIAALVSTYVVGRSAPEATTDRTRGDQPRAVATPTTAPPALPTSSRLDATQTPRGGGAVHSSAPRKRERSGTAASRPRARPERRRYFCSVCDGKGTVTDASAWGVEPPPYQRGYLVQQLITPRRCRHCDGSGKDVLARLLDRTGEPNRWELWEYDRGFEEYLKLPPGTPSNGQDREFNPWYDGPRQLMEAGRYDIVEHWPMVEMDYHLYLRLFWADLDGKATRITLHKYMPGVWRRSAAGDTKLTKDQAFGREYERRRWEVLESQDLVVSPGAAMAGGPPAKGSRESSSSLLRRVRPTAK